ncbi:MAG TPA: hypothetical protein VD906_00590 [Caulobacteraceae bacterium]|nr:hypothetical protein [Caulobacteraceae bacterium]
MTDVHTTTFEPHHQHALISWQAVLAGAVIAVAVGAMLNLLGMALGAAAIDPYELTRGEAEGFTVGAGVWIAIANAIALFVGGFVASRAAKHSDHHRGVLNGLAVWAIAFLLAILIAAATASGSVASALGGATEAAPEAAQVADTMMPGTGAGADQGTDNTAAVPAPAREEADQAADSTSAASLWGFLTMLLGAIAAVLGGRYGSRKHGWETKAGIGEAPSVRVPNTRI